MDDPLASMLEARSVAVVGASSREGSFGRQMMEQLLGGGFDGAVHPVNPRHREVMGLPCLPTLADLPGPVDVAVLGVANAMLEDQLRAAADSGARSAVIFASCYEAPHPDLPPLTDRLAAIAREAGMALCGGNGMGFVNVERHLRACGFHEPDDLEPGGITFLSHSGSAFSAMLHNDRGLRFNLVVSTGLELVSTMDEYLDYALDLESTRAIGVFMEAVRMPDAFRAALARAWDRDVPVVAMKVGRATAAREMVAAHSGALAGEDGAFEALFDAHGVLRAESLDEMCDTLELFVAGRRAGRGGLAAIHDSGGERALLIDAAESSGLRLAAISGHTSERLAEVLEPGLPAVNPLDAWGTGNRADEIFIESMHLLLDDADTAALAFCVDLTTELIPEEGYTRVANEVFAKTDKPVAVLSNMAAAIDRRDADFVRRAGIPVLEGTWNGLAAFRHLFEYRDNRARPPVPATPLDPDAVEEWRGHLRSNRPLGEPEALALVGDFGIPIVANARAGSPEEALDGARSIGWPVALKTAEPAILHKTGSGGVRLGLRDEDELRAAYRELAGRLGPNVLVQAMAPPGVELALGVVRDEQFGPLVMVAAGGVLIEVLRDRRFALPPLDSHRALAMLDRLAIRPLLDGSRGRPPAEIARLADAVVRMSAIATALGDEFDALDVNPLIVGPGGCVAVDALVVPRART
jgi:acyl-CoA synthetase (NDP forming)